MLKITGVKLHMIALASGPGRLVCALFTIAETSLHPSGDKFMVDTKVLALVLETFPLYVLTDDIFVSVPFPSEICEPASDPASTWSV